EHGEILAHRTASIHGAFDGHCDATGRELLLACEDLHELYPAGGHACEEQLARIERLARTPVLLRAVHHEMMIARTAEHPAEGIGRACLCRIGACRARVHRLLRS